MAHIIKIGSFYERYCSRRGQRLPSLSDHHVRIEADPAHLRQADDLLSAIDPDVGRNKRYSDHFDAPRSAVLPGALQ